MALVRCMSCKGLGHVNGMGGIQRDCKVCDGVGKIEKVASVDISAKPVEKEPEIVHIAEAELSVAIDEESKKQVLPKKKEVELETLDPITQACIEEPRMDPIAWQNKFQNVQGLFAKSMITGQIEACVSKVQRAGIRASYAAQQPMAARTVDLNKAQDAASRTDADYIAYKNQEKARLKKEATKK